MALKFAVKVMPAERGGFVAICRDLPEVLVQADSVEDALPQAADAMAAALAERTCNGMAVPQPSKPAPDEHLVSASRP